MEEKITIGESSSHPREQTGEAGERLRSDRKGRIAYLKTCSDPIAQQNLTHLSRKTLLKDPRGARLELSPVRSAKSSIKRAAMLRCCMLRGCLFGPSTLQQADDSLVGDLAEVVVPQADRVQLMRRA